MIILCQNNEYGHIYYAQASSTSDDPDLLPKDLRQLDSAPFAFASQEAVQDDQHELQRRLESLASSEHGVGQKQRLAGYLLKKLKYTLDLSQANTSDTCNAILWAKECRPDIWGPPCLDQAEVVF